MHLSSCSIKWFEVKLQRSFNIQLFNVKRQKKKHTVVTFKMFYSSTIILCCKMAVQLGIKRRSTKWKITDSSSNICLNPYRAHFLKPQ